MNLIKNAVNHDVRIISGNMIENRYNKGVFYMTDESTMKRFAQTSPLSAQCKGKSSMSFDDISFIGYQKTEIEIIDNYREYECIIVSSRYANAAISNYRKGQIPAVLIERFGPNAAFEFFDFIDRMYFLGSKVFSRTNAGKSLAGNSDLNKAYLDYYDNAEQAVYSYCRQLEMGYCPSRISVGLLVDYVCNYKPYYLKNSEIYNSITRLKMYISSLASVNVHCDQIFNC